MKLTAIVIVKNEARNIEACLRSVAFADQRVVVDSGSSDGTVELARKLGAEVIETHDWPGFGPQKNRALDAARGEWVLSIDADERVTASSQKEILEAISSASEFSAYKLPRFTCFFGSWIKHCGWYPDYHVRLFRREKARFTDDLVHESIQVKDERVGNLDYPLIHYSFRSHGDLLRKLQHYSVLSSEQAYRKGRRSSLTKAIAIGMADFLRMYIWRRGFLDGRAGLIVSLLSGEAMFHKYLGIALMEDQYLTGDPAPPTDRP